MKSFEQLFSEFYGAEIDDAAQIQLYSHSGTELKDFVNYCIEQTGTNTLVSGSCDHKEVISVRHAYKCSKCGELLV